MFFKVNIYMLIYIKSIGIINGQNETSVETNLSNITIKYQLSIYNQLFHIVKKDNEDTLYYLDMEKYRINYQDSDLTTLYFLDEVADNDLLLNPPFTYIGTVKYHDAHKVNYRALPCRIDTNINTPLPVYYRKDLFVRRITREVNYSQLRKQVLVTVNGYIHLTDTNLENNVDGLYIIDGGNTYLRSNDNQLGFLDFRDVGELSFYPFKNDDIINEIYPNQDLRPLRDKTIFKTNTSLEGKSVILSMGGYLIFPDYRWFYQTGENEFTFIPLNINILEKFFESYNYLKLDHLGLDFSNQFPDRVNVNEYLSDDVLRKYFTMSQTFLIVVDTPSLYTQSILINKGGYPGKFFTYQEPKYPLIMNHGKIAEYWSVKEGNAWSISIADGFLRNFTFGYKQSEQLNVVTDAQQPMMPFMESKGNMLQIYTRK